MANTVESNGIRVLVVDDESSICRALTIVYSRAGYEVKAVESGKSAEDLLRTEHFDCMVVDLLLPDTRGDVLFHIASALQPHLAHQTIFTTGDFTEHAQDLIDACHCPALLKPFELRELLSMTEHATQARKSRDASA